MAIKMEKVQGIGEHLKTIIVRSNTTILLPPEVVLLLPITILFPPEEVPIIAYRTLPENMRSGIIYHFSYSLVESDRL